MKDIRIIIKNRREELQLTQQQVADAVGVSEATVSRWETGDIGDLKRSRIMALANILQISPSIIVGVTESESSYHLVNIFPIGTKQHPLLGDIACGEPILATEQFESYVAAGADIKADFCLRCKGNSMINARIHDEDIVFIRKQPMVENGEIAAVVIDNEATLKRVYYHKEDGWINLVSENPAFPPLVYAGNDLNKVIILGKAVAFQSDVK